MIVPPPASPANKTYLTTTIQKRIGSHGRGREIDQQTDRMRTDMQKQKIDTDTKYKGVQLDLINDYELPVICCYPCGVCVVMPAFCVDVVA